MRRGIGKDMTVDRQTKVISPRLLLIGGLFGLVSYALSVIVAYVLSGMFFSGLAGAFLFAAVPFAGLVMQAIVLLPTFFIGRWIVRKMDFQHENLVTLFGMLGVMVLTAPVAGMISDFVNHLIDGGIFTYFVELSVDAVVSGAMAILTGCAAMILAQSVESYSSNAARIFVLLCFGMIALQTAAPVLFSSYYDDRNLAEKDERSIELTNAVGGGSVYVPPASGEWTQPEYLEVKHDNSSQEYVLYAAGDDTYGDFEEIVFNSGDGLRSGGIPRKDSQGCGLRNENVYVDILAGADKCERIGSLGDSEVYLEWASAGPVAGSPERYVWYVVDETTYFYIKKEIPLGKSEAIKTRTLEFISHLTPADTGTLKDLARNYRKAQKDNVWLSRGESKVDLNTGEGIVYVPATGSKWTQARYLNITETGDKMIYDVFPADNEVDGDFGYTMVFEPLTLADPVVPAADGCEGTGSSSGLVCIRQVYAGEDMSILREDVPQYNQYHWYVKRGSSYMTMSRTIEGDDVEKELERTVEFIKQLEPATKHELQMLERAEAKRE